MQHAPAARREVLRDILAHGRPADQVAIASALRRRGFPTTQATISRDLAAIGAIRAAKAYALPTSRETVPPPDELSVLARSIVTLDAAGDALLVIRTGIGMAQRTGLAIDRLGWPEVAGTVAGDDTIFVATHNRRDQRALLARIRSACKGEPS